MPIVEAVGSTSPLGRGVRGRFIEHAMAQAVLDTAKESEAIWNRTDIDVEEKNKLIAAINAPEALRARKLHYREVAKQAFAAEVEKLTASAREATEQAASEK